MKTRIDDKDNRQFRGEELAADELNQIVGGVSFTYGSIEWTYTTQKAA